MCTHERYNTNKHVLFLQAVMKSRYDVQTGVFNLSMTEQVACQKQPSSLVLLPTGILIVTAKPGMLYSKSFCTSQSLCYSSLSSLFFSFYFSLFSFSFSLVVLCPMSCCTHKLLRCDYSPWIRAS